MDDSMKLLLFGTYTTKARSGTFAVGNGEAEFVQSVSRLHIFYEHFCVKLMLWLH